MSSPIRLPGFALPFAAGLALAAASAHAAARPAPELRLVGGARRTIFGTPIGPRGGAAATPAPAPAAALAPPAQVAGGTPPTVDGQWTELGPPPRLGAAMAYDSRRDRWLLFGGVPGYGSSELVYSNDTWEFDPAHDRQWRRVEVEGELPPGAAGHRVAYDAARDRLLLFGGSRAVPIGGGYVRFEYFRDVWALGLSGTPAWTRLDAPGGPATGRTLPGLAYDPAGDRLLVFGGFYEDDANHDPNYYGQSFADLWEFSLAGGGAWKLLADGGGPAPRNETLLGVDPAAARLLLIGGLITVPDSVHVFRNTDLFDVWSWPLDGSGTWTALDAGSVRPGDRYGFGQAWDPAARRAYVVGGVSLDPLSAFLTDDLWVLDAGTSPRWFAPSVAAGAPSPRENASCVVDPTRGQCVLYSGDDGLAPFTDTWSFPSARPGAWTPVDPPAGPGPAREGASAGLDAAAGRLVVFGGERPEFDLVHDYSFFDDLRAQDLATGAWSALAPPGPAPSARAYAATAFDAARRRLWIAGGLSETGDAATEAWSLDLAPAPRWTNWSQLPGGPWPIEDGVAIEDPIGRRMIVFGRTLNATAPGLWALANDAPTAWAAIPASGDPPPPHGRAAAYDARRRRMLVFGGYDGASPGPVSDVYALPLDGPPAWTRVAAGGELPPPELGSSAVYDSVGDRMIVFGGEIGGGFPSPVTADAYELRFADPGPATWRALRLRGGPPLARIDAVSAFDTRHGTLHLGLGWDGYAAPFADTWRLDFVRPALEIALLVRPGSASGAAPPGARAPLPIALLSGAGFDPAQVDAPTLRLDGVPAMDPAPRAVGRATRDWNGDGVNDRIAWFDGALARAGASGGQLELTGSLLDGTSIHGVATLGLRADAHAGPNEGAAPVAAGSAAAAPSFAGPLALVGLARAGADGLRLAFASPLAGAFTADVHDVRGRRVATATGVIDAPGDARVELGAVGPLAPGIYFARVRIRGEEAVRRFVLLR